jgi:formiminoglutamase/agmatinase
LQNRITDNQIYDVENRKLIDLKDLQIIDYGDIDIVAYSTDLTFQNAEAKVSKILEDGSFPFILVGYQSISYPRIKALHDHSKGKVGIIQFDAHLDLVDDSPIQGRFSQSSQMRRALELPHISPENIVQIGVRSYNYPWYAEYLANQGIVQMTAREVHHMTAKEVIMKTLDACKDVDVIYLTFDIDVLDPAFAPGSGANEPGGLTPVQCFEILDGLYEHIHAMDIAEVNPLYDHQDITVSIGAKLLFDCFDQEISGSFIGHKFNNRNHCTPIR